MSIRRPLSPGAEWIEISLYRAYAELAREHIADQRYFEAIVVCCLGYDVLVNTLPDRIRVHHYEKLTPDQQKVVGDLEKGERLTAGRILKRLRKANILHWRLDRALSQFNQKRNSVVHPIERQEKVEPNGSTSHFLSLKQDAVFPYKAAKEDANRYFRQFCHIIDLSGGESPLKNEKASRRYSVSKVLEEIEEERRIK